MTIPLSQEEIQAIEEKYQTDAAEKVIRDLIHTVRYYKNDAEVSNELITSMSQRMTELVEFIGRLESPALDSDLTNRHRVAKQLRKLVNA